MTSNPQLQVARYLLEQQAPDLPRPEREEQARELAHLISLHDLCSHCQRLFFNGAITKTPHDPDTCVLTW